MLVQCQAAELRLEVLNLPSTNIHKLFYTICRGPFHISTVLSSFWDCDCELVELELLDASGDEVPRADAGRADAGRADAGRADGGSCSDS